MQVEKIAEEKRKKAPLTPEEKSILKSLFVKTLGPIMVIIFISSLVLYLGLHFLMEKTSFSNFGLTPVRTLSNVSHFVTTYIVIAVSNVFLMMALSIVVIYIILHNIVLPIMRITRNVKDCMGTENKIKICVRETDLLFVPLVDLINKLLGEVKHR